MNYGVNEIMAVYPGTNQGQGDIGLCPQAACGAGYFQNPTDGRTNKKGRAISEPCLA